MTKKINHKHAKCAYSKHHVLHS